MQCEKKIDWLVVFFIIIQLFVSNEFFFVIGIILIIYIHSSKKNSIGKIYIIPEFRFIFFCILIGVFLGLISMGNQIVMFKDIIRDIFYFINPLVFIYIGVLYSYQNMNIYTMCNSFIIGGIIVSIYELIITARNFSAAFNSVSVEQWRSSSGKGEIIITVALAIMLSNVIPKKNEISRWIIYSGKAICGLYFIICLSRTNTIVLIILYISLSIEKGNTQKFFISFFKGMIVFFVAIMIVILLLPENIVEAYSDKIFSSFTEIGVNNNWSKELNVVANWRGYENYCAIKQWNNYSAMKKIIGAGFGEKIYVGKYAYTLLQQVDDYGFPSCRIPILHNGYMTHLIKFGVFGLSVYVIFYISIVYKGIKYKRIDDSIESRLLIGIGVTFFIITYFLNGLFGSYSWYSLLLTMGYSLNKYNNLLRGEKKCEKSI